jgi:ribosomal protein S18 acetylase RimI-like enzyme
MIMVREAENDDVPACAALQPLYTTRTVWRMVQEGETGPTRGEEIPALSLYLQQVRLPQSRVLRLPSSLVPLERVWDSAGTRFVAVQDDEHICGYLLLRLLPDQCLVMVSRFLVDAPARGQGAGKALLRAARAWAASEGEISLLAHAPLRNVPGIGFYQRRGFRICGLSQHFYPTREDALLLRQNV